jgi:uncharacterized glyoxalase superfamily protein PhnB
MKKLLFIILVSAFFACEKQIDYLPQITALQKSRDSLSVALAQTNATVAVISTNVIAINKSIDSVKLQLTSIGNQITALNTQMTSVNVDIESIKSQLSLLNQKYADLLLKLNIILTQLSATPSSLLNGLVAFYPLNGNALDSSGYNLNGTITGALAINDRFGNTGKAMKFSGAATSNNTVVTKDDFIQIPNFNINFSNKISISLWANVDKENYADFLNRRVDNNIDFAISSYGGSTGYTPDPNTISWHIGGNRTNAGVTVIPYNTWHNYIYIFDGSTMKVYLDGILESQGSFSGVITNNSNVLMIGKYIYHGGLTHYFYYKGALDDIRFYNRVLTDSEIFYLANH